MPNICGRKVQLRRADEDDYDVGARLKAFRKSKGISQRKLARRSGVSNGTISLIEQNKISPSVASLKLLLDGMHLSISEFFSDQRPTNKNIFFAADELAQYCSGGIAFRQVGENLADRRMQIMHECYAPEADTGEPMLRHEGEEGGIVLRGRVEITVADQGRVLSAGDAYYFKSSWPHRFRNVGDEPCEIVSACTPPTF